MKTSTHKANTKPKSETKNETKTQPVSSTAPAPSTALPEGYLADGTMLDIDGTFRPEYSVDYPQQLADLLKPLRATTFFSTFLENTEDIGEDDDPYFRCVKEMIPQAMMLVRHRAAPAVLVSMILAAIDTVHDTATFNAFYQHLIDIYLCMEKNEDANDPLVHLLGGLMDENGVLRSEYLREYAFTTAVSLRPMKASTFHRAFLKEAESARKNEIPDDAKKSCAEGMVVEARKLVFHRKAPRALLSVMEGATATVKDAASFDALYRYLDAVYSFILQEERWNILC